MNETGKTSSLDDILADAEQRRERVQKRAEQKREGFEERAALILADVDKYEQIVDNECAQDLKECAWDALIAAYPEAQKVAPHDLVGFYESFELGLQSCIDEQNKLAADQRLVRLKKTAKNMIIGITGMTQAALSSALNPEGTPPMNMETVVGGIKKILKESMLDKPKA